MDSAVSDLVASLRGVDSVGPQWDVVDSWVRDGELELLLDAARALSGPPPTAVPKWAADSVLGRIARVMALTPRPGFAKATSQIARLVGARELAALAASAQDLEACATLVGEVDEQDAEFTACLVQELVLREGDLEREPFTSSWRSSVSQGHPLRWLPLRLLPLERSISLPSYSLTGSAAGLPICPRRSSPRDRTSD